MKHQEDLISLKTPNGMCLQNGTTIFSVKVFIYPDTTEEQILLVLQEVVYFARRLIHIKVYSSFSKKSSKDSTADHWEKQYCYSSATVTCCHRKSKKKGPAFSSKYPFFPQKHATTSKGRVWPIKKENL